MPIENRDYYRDRSWQTKTTRPPSRSKKQAQGKKKRKGKTKRSCVIAWLLATALLSIGGYTAVYIDIDKNVLQKVTEATNRIREETVDEPTWQRSHDQEQDTKQPSTDGAVPTYDEINERTAAQFDTDVHRPSQNEGGEPSANFLETVSEAITSIPFINEQLEQRRRDREIQQAEDINQVEQRIHDGINAHRTKRGRQPLRWDAGLAHVARAHSNDMVTRDYFDHVTPDGLNPTGRLHVAGLSCRKETHWGIAENISITLELSSMDHAASDAVLGWIYSRGHLQNLLGMEYNATGVGAAFGKWKGYNALYLTQVFC